MPITVMKMDGTTEVIEPIPGTSCKETMLDRGVYSGPPDSFAVLFENNNVDDEPVEDYVGKKLILTPRREKGGS